MSRSSNDTMRERMIEAGIDPDWHRDRPQTGSEAVDVHIDIADAPGAIDRTREIVADHRGTVIHVNPHGPGGGNPYFHIRARSIESARQLVKELLGEPGLTDDEIDGVYIDADPFDMDECDDNWQEDNP